MEKVQNALNWFEIPVTDFDRARSFYSNIFDFEMPSMPMGNTMIGLFNL
jgi:predicted enzyme related to lactoylglutathione lyase